MPGSSGGGWGGLDGTVAPVATGVIVLAVAVVIISPFGRGLIGDALGQVGNYISGAFSGTTTPRITEIRRDVNGNGKLEAYTELQGVGRCYWVTDEEPAAQYASNRGLRFEMKVPITGQPACVSKIGEKTADNYLGAK